MKQIIKNMSYQINKLRKEGWDKKGVSVLIGYVLLISFVIVISVIVYQLLQTYAPSEIQSCPSGTSIILKDYECDNKWLNLTVKNNGLFNVGGVFVYASIDEEIEIPTFDLVGETRGTPTNPSIHGGVPAGNSLLFNLNSENSLVVDDEQLIVFNLWTYARFPVDGASKIYYVGLTPIRFQEEDGKTKLISCGNSNIIQKLECPVTTYI